MTLQPSSSMAPWSPVAVQRSPWHSPVPYLFGGLAAMLGLIAFALLILACTYNNQSGDTDGDRDLEAGDTKPDDHNKEPPFFEEKYLVIMAGQAKPTFLATPISSKASSFVCSCSSRSNWTDKASTSEMEMEKVQESSYDHLQERNTVENQETTDDQLPI